MTGTGRILPARQEPFYSSAPVSSKQHRLTKKMQSFPGFLTRCPESAQQHLSSTYTCITQQAAPPSATKMWERVKYQPFEFEEELHPKRASFLRFGTLYARDGRGYCDWNPCTRQLSRDAKPYVAVNSAASSWTANVNASHGTPEPRCYREPPHALHVHNSLQPIISAPLTTSGHLCHINDATTSSCSLTLQRETKRLRHTALTVSVPTAPTAPTTVLRMPVTKPPPKPVTQQLSPTHASSLSRIPSRQLTHKACQPVGFVAVSEASTSAIADATNHGESAPSTGVPTVNILSADARPSPALCSGLLSGMTEVCDVVLDNAGNDDVAARDSFLKRCAQTRRMSVALVWNDRPCNTLSNALAGTAATTVAPPAPIFASTLSSNFTPQRRRKGGVKKNSERERGRNASVLCALFLLPLPSPTASVCKTQVEASAESGVHMRQQSTSFLLPLWNDAGWSMLAAIFALKQTEKVLYDAQLCLIPFFQWHKNRNGSMIEAEVHNCVDPKIAAHMLDARRTEDALHFDTLVREMPVKDQASDIDNDDCACSAPATLCSRVDQFVRACFDHLKIVLLLQSRFDTQLQNIGSGCVAAFRLIETNLIPVLASMEVRGIYIETSRLLRLRNRIDKEISELEKRANTLAGYNFNMASPEQVAHVLFDVLKLSLQKGQRSNNSTSHKGSTKHPSVDKSVLEALMQQTKHPIIALVLRSRSLIKFKGTYIDGLVNHASLDINGTGIGSIHAWWNQCSVETGRLSSARPNLQNLPRPGMDTGEDDMAVVRDAFVPQPLACSGCGSDEGAPRVLLSADYSQIEMRVLAELSGDKDLIGLFRSEHDIYAELASHYLNKPAHSVTPLERSQAKTLLLALMYGLGVPEAAKRLGVTWSRAEKLKSSFLDRFPVLKHWLDSTKRKGMSLGYAQTITGRRRLLGSPPDCSLSRAARARTERQLVNSTVQGSAADLMKLAMISVATALDSWHVAHPSCGTQPRIVAMIHDELLLELCGNGQALATLIDTVRRCMTHDVVQILNTKFGPTPVWMNVPLRVNMKVGSRWGSMKEV